MRATTAGPVVVIMRQKPGSGSEQGVAPGGESPHRSRRVLPEAMCPGAEMCNSMRFGAPDECANYEARPQA